MARLSATEVSRNFSAVLTRLALGEEVEVFRSGQPVARITPARPIAMSASAFRALMLAAPPVDSAFVRHLDRAEEDLPPPGDPWPS